MKEDTLDSLEEEAKAVLDKLAADTAVIRAKQRLAEDMADARNEKELDALIDVTLMDRKLERLERLIRKKLKVKKWSIYMFVVGGIGVVITLILMRVS